VQRILSYLSRAAGVGYNEDGSARRDEPGNCRYCPEDVQSPQPPAFNGVRRQVNTYRLAVVMDCINLVEVCEILHTMRQSYPALSGLYIRLPVKWSHGHLVTVIISRNQRNSMGRMRDCTVEFFRMFQISRPTHRVTLDLSSFWHERNG